MYPSPFNEEFWAKWDLSRSLWLLEDSNFFLKILYIFFFSFFFAYFHFFQKLSYKVLLKEEKISVSSGNFLLCFFLPAYNFGDNFFVSHVDLFLKSFTEILMVLRCHKKLSRSCSSSLSLNGKNASAVDAVLFSIWEKVILKLRQTSLAPWDL